MLAMRICDDASIWSRTAPNIRLAASGFRLGERCDRGAVELPGVLRTPLLQRRRVPPVLPAKLIDPAEPITQRCREPGRVLSGDHPVRDSLRRGSGSRLRLRDPLLFLPVAHAASNHALGHRRQAHGEKLPNPRVGLAADRVGLVAADLLGEPIERFDGIAAALLAELRVRLVRLARVVRLRLGDQAFVLDLLLRDDVARHRLRRALHLLAELTKRPHRRGLVRHRRLAERLEAARDRAGLLAAYGVDGGYARHIVNPMIAGMLGMTTPLRRMSEN